jgi:hypothetical protein
MSYPVPYPPRHPGLGQTAPVVVNATSTGPSTLTYCALLAAAGLAIYFLFFRGKSRKAVSPAPGVASAPLAQNPQRKKRKVKRNPETGKFEKLRQKIVARAHRTGYPLYDPSGRAIAAAVGRRKFGKKRFQAMAQSGRRRARHRHSS